MGYTYIYKLYIYTIIYIMWMSPRLTKHPGLTLYSLVSQTNKPSLVASGAMCSTDSLYPLVSSNMARWDVSYKRFFKMGKSPTNDRQNH
jgi:hypothetical protein